MACHWLQRNRKHLPGDPAAHVLCGSLLIIADLAQKSRRCGHNPGLYQSQPSPACEAISTCVPGIALVQTACFAMTDLAGGACQETMQHAIVRWLVEIGYELRQNGHTQNGEVSCNALELILPRVKPDEFKQQLVRPHGGCQGRYFEHHQEVHKPLKDTWQ